MAENRILNNTIIEQKRNEESSLENQHAFSKILKVKSNNASINKYIVFKEEKLPSSKLLTAFYTKTNFQPVWLNEKGALKLTKSFLDTLKDSKSEGLDPSFYWAERIESGIKELKKTDKKNKTTHYNYLADLELLITNSALTYFSDLIFGRYKLSNILLDSIYTEPYIDLIDLTIHSIETKSFNRTKELLLPKSPVYKSLKSALQKYKDIKQNGGWPNIPQGPKLVKDNSDPRVIPLKKRLYITNDLKVSNKDLETYLNNAAFDNYLEQSVKSFQKRNGLTDDGIVGKNTLAALNVNIDQRLNSLKLNLDLWRRLPQDLGRRHILVNVPAFKLFGFENNSSTIEMRVIVGRLDWNTPIFSEYIEYIVINPYWNIPKTIFKDEILPELISDPSYLSKKNIKILGPESDSLDPLLIDWSTVDPKSWTYRLRQEPGAANPLGRLKFIFPNKHSVYLHDTPNKRLFDRENRKLSHGCIRVEKPIDLAKFVFSDDNDWNTDRVQNIINSGSSRTVYLKQPIPVHILYFTAWVENDGSINFRKDIYNLIQSDKLQTNKLL